MNFNFQSPFWAGIIHAVKVIGFIFISGGLTALLNYSANLHLTSFEWLFVSGVINAILAWIKKYQDVRMTQNG